MTIDRDDKEVMIIKRETMNTFKQTDKIIDNMKKSSCHDNAKFKKVLKSVFDLRFRNSDLEFILMNIITLNSVDDLIINSVHLILSIAFLLTKNKTLIKNSAIKSLKNKTSLKFKCFKNNEFFN